MNTTSEKTIEILKIFSLAPKEYKKWELPFVRRQRAYLHPDGKWDIVKAEEEREFTCVESRKFKIIYSFRLGL